MFKPPCAIYLIRHLQLNATRLVPSAPLYVYKAVHVYNASLLEPPSIISSPCVRVFTDCMQTCAVHRRAVWAWSYKETIALPTSGVSNDAGQGRRRGSVHVRARARLGLVHRTVSGFSQQVFLIGPYVLTVSVAWVAFYFIIGSHNGSSLPVSRRRLMANGCVCVSRVQGR